MRRIALSITILALVSGACSQGGADKAPPPKSTASTDTSAAVGVPYCVVSDMRMAIAVRRPSPRQVDSPMSPMQPQHRVVTIVLRNVSGHLCRFESAYDLTIYDRVGRIVGQWDDPRWFGGTYRSGEVGTFSLPEVYRCERLGPFWAFAAVGPYSARRHGLHLSDITCLHGADGKQ